MGMLLHRQGDSQKSSRLLQVVPEPTANEKKVESTSTSLKEELSEGVMGGGTPPVKKSGRAKKTV